MDKLWEKAQKQAKQEYEKEHGGSWEDADKSEREDWVFSMYIKIKEEKNNVN